MLLSHQPPGYVGSLTSLPTQAAINNYDATKLFKLLLSPSAVAVRPELSFSSDLDMPWLSLDPLDMKPPSPPTTALPIVRPYLRANANHHNSPGLRTFRRASEDLQAELRYSSGPWDEDELDAASTFGKSGTESGTVRRHSQNFEVDVFDLQHRRDSSLEPNQLDMAANHFHLPTLSLTHKTPTNTQTLPPTPPTYSADTKAMYIVGTKRLHSPLQSIERDPRALFGAKETHLPWVTRLSPNRFSMRISPDVMSRDAPPPKSVWDAEDNEFDRWPTAAEARKELDSVRQNATTKRGTFVRPVEPELDVAEKIAEAVRTPMGDATRSLSEEEQTILELEDMDCGNPMGRDLHDSIMMPLRSRDYTLLPASAPTRHMHALDAKAYTTSTDPVVVAARPRLCDAVATILAYTSPQCLADFLNPEVEVFEWRRLINCVMIRREGNKVMVGTYYNYGTMYQWGYLVRSTIDNEGAWTETWASVCQGMTPIGKDGVLFNQFQARDADCGVEPDDEEFALYTGRQLADFLLRYEVWNYYKWWRYSIEWETDGKLTRARDGNRYPAGLTFD
jgi:hypothetical protein